VVEDNGIGLPQDQREKLTEPYVTTREKGTGLGLAIVKKIMEDHSGRLMLDDSLGGGARITLFFRTDPDDDKKPAEPQPTAEQRALLTAARVGIHGA
jgi:two-component system nitrogen regulation sensor histidine kinase NtrY